MNENIGTHQHPTKEEFYLFYEGQATFIINGKDFSCTSGTFVKVPAGVFHRLGAVTTIRFIYWGVQLRNNDGTKIF